MILLFLIDSKPSTTELHLQPERMHNYCLFMWMFTWEGALGGAHMHIRVHAKVRGGCQVLPSIIPSSSLKTESHCAWSS